MTQTDIWVLVVDDVNSMRVQIRELLKQFGFRNVHIEESIEKAKIAIETQKFQLILCDWHLGSGSGFDFLKYIRHHPDYHEVAFVMVTAEGTKELVLEAVKAGVDDYLLKPLTISQIQNKVYGTLLRKKVLS